MARFRGTIRGQRGSASRLGSAKSGLEVDANGWDVGVHISAQPQPGDGEDIFYIYASGGSNRRNNRKHIGSVLIVDGLPRFVPAVQS